MDEVDIRWSLVVVLQSTGDFVGVTFKRDKPTLEPTDLLIVDWDRTELAENTGLALTLEPVPEREERVRGRHPIIQSTTKLSILLVLLVSRRQTS